MYMARSRMKCANIDGKESQANDEEEEREGEDTATDSDASESDLSDVSEDDLEVPLSSSPARKRKNF